MAAELPESDWRVLRNLRKAALERFCERVLGELQRVVSDKQTASHTRYLMIYELIQKRDRAIAQTFNNPRRSNALIQLANIISLDLVTEEELRSFTPRTQSVVAALGKTRRDGRAIKRA